MNVVGWIMSAVVLTLPLVAWAQPGAMGPPVAIPEGVTVERDRPYAGTDNPAQTLDLYLPSRREADRLLPAIVSIHGGAFMFGDKRGGLARLVPLVASGEFVGVSINYRLSGEATWPAQAHDCKAAIRWVRANAGRHGIDPERIAVMGESAGGHLATIIGLGGGVPELEGELGGHRDVSSRVRCVVNLFGPSDLVRLPDDGSRDDHASAKSPEGRLIGGDVRENADRARAASPIRHVSKDDPPFLIIHGSDDPVIPHAQSQRLHAALQAAGVSSTFITITGGGHGGFRSPEIDRRIRAFFGRHLLDEDVTVSDTPIPN